MTVEHVSAFTNALNTVLDRVLDPAIAGKLERLYGAADRCVANLRGVDLRALERDDEDGGPDLGLWEQVAPAVGQVLGAVGGLMQVIAADFPEGETGAHEADIDPVETAKADEAAFAVRAAKQVLQGHVVQLGQNVRNPEIVATRWKLLECLQAAVGRFYSAIGDMVYASAVAFGEVRRADIVPYHAETLKEALTLRRAVTDLTRVSAMYVERLKNVVHSEMTPLVHQLERDLGAFSKTAAYRTLWARDKQELAEHRKRLREITPTIDAEIIRETVGEFAEFVGGLGEVNNRAMIVEHDRELAQACVARLAEAQGLQPTDPSAAAVKMAEALGQCWGLYGRSDQLDQFLRELRKRGAVQLSAEQFAAELAHVRELVERVPLALP